MKPPRLSLQKNIIWNSSGSLVYLVFQWLISYLVVILLGFTDAGIFSLALSISGIAFAFALYGVRGYQVSDIANKYSDESYIFARVVTCVIAVGGVLVYIVAHTYSVYTSLCIFAYLTFKTSEAYVDVYHGIFQKGNRMDFIGKSFILRGTVGNILAIACMALTKNLLLSLGILTFSSWLLVFVYDRKRIIKFYAAPRNASSRKIINLLVECLPLAVYTLLASFFMYIPRISLQDIRGSEALGIYTSIAIPAVIIQVVSGYIFSPLLTVFAEHVNARNFQLFHRLLFKTLGYILLLSLVVIVTGDLFGNFGLSLLFGDKIHPYTYLFLPILFLSSLTALSWFIGLMLTVIRELRGLIVASVISALICLFGSGTFIHSYGINGTSFVLIIALVVQLGLMGTFMAIKLRSLSRAVLHSNLG